ncbi:MAG: DUF1566 domain-containing protein [Deltaproteobacteria bacterium]|nr:DUF1566 domain-containing protein [Deltaproteobacteria bacterium]
MELECGSDGDPCYDDAHHRAGVLKSGETISPSGETPVFLTDGSVEGDWRLPTKKECVEFSTGDEYVRASNPQLFEGVQEDGYWSSSTKSTKTNWASYMSMAQGDMPSGYKYYPYWVWPVRSGN